MDLRTATRRLFGLGCYAAGGLVTPYFLLFAGDLAVPITVNTGERCSPAAALAVDLGLIAMFGLQHSLMTLPAWKRGLARWLPPSLERSVYVLAASLALASVMIGWRPIAGDAWRLEGAGAGAMTAGYVGGFALVYAAALWLDHFHLLGLRQAWTGAPDAAPSELRVRGPYRFMRHPLMTGLLCVFWLTPHMTWSQLVLAAGMTGYVVIGTLHEERALARRFGRDYAVYARLTPMLTPAVLTPLLRYRARLTAPAALHVRRPDLDHTPYGPAVWYGDNVVGTALMTAYSALFPPLERFMADELRAAIPVLRDPALARAVRAFAGQESAHAREHARSLDGLTGLGYRVRFLERAFELVTRRVLRPAVRWLMKPLCGTAGSVAIFAGVEHWTATMAEMVLQMRYPRSYGSILAMYYWHAAEELEHKSVVADVLRHLGGSYFVRIVAFLSGTLVFALLSVIGTAIILAQIPVLQGRGPIGWLCFPMRVVRDGVMFLLVREKLAWHVLRSSLVYLMPFYHPSRRATDALVRRGLAASADAGAAFLGRARP